MINIDGINYDVGITSLSFAFEVIESSQSGETQAGTVIHDVRGTRYAYSLTVLSKGGKYDEYNNFLNDIETPKPEGRVVKMPHLDTEIQFTAFVKSGMTPLVKRINGVNKWGTTTIVFESMELNRVVTA